MMSSPNSSDRKSIWTLVINVAIMALNAILTYIS